ncbi:MAG: 50S ribosomal protein L15 [Thermoanaerobaculia bacterium]|nr:50S ribosomal protein L15 [Thermoanaerobaculia bacterium]
MKLHELSPAPGSTHSKKRVGRGKGSGLGKTAGKGHKGGQSRSGYSVRPGFEGGQMPLVRRVPKRGFNNIFRVEYVVVNVAQLGDLGATVTPELLAERGLVHQGRPIKVLGNGEIKAAVTVAAHKFSQTARAKIEAAGGRCEEIA